MPREKLYLVRRDLETFTGPLTVTDISKAMERMSVGLRDEVSGHCGPWVFLDDRERLRRFYPELLSIVQATSVSGWSADVGGFRNEPTVKGPVSITSQKPSRRWLMAAAFFGLALVAALVAWLLAGSGELSSRIVGPAMPATTDYDAMLASGQDREFMTSMEPQLERVMDRAMRKRDALSTWIPYLRAFAFIGGNGEIDGFPSKKLRGEAGVAAPADCSMKSWVKRWRDGVAEFQAVANGGDLPSDHWGRVLAWDPWWINRRGQSGWIRPRNFYQGCIAMASMALQQQANAPGAAAVRHRMEWLRESMIPALPLLQASQGPQAGQNAATSSALAAHPDSSVFSLWNCMDKAKSRIELDRCLEAPWQNLMQDDYNREKFYWATLRLAVQARMSGDKSEWKLVRKDLEAFLAGRDHSDSYTRLDYSEELRFIGSVNGKLPESLETSSPSLVPALAPAKSRDEDIQVDLAH